jgi:hypothetical protein
MLTIKRHTSLGLALTSLGVLAATAGVPAQQYLPNRPPMAVSWQGAENPVWYSSTFFCGAIYEWQGDRYGQMGRLMDSANVRIGIRSDRRERDLNATLTTTVFSGSPTYGSRFTTPSCDGRETAEFDVIGKLYGYSLARVGPATFVRKVGR